MASRSIIAGPSTGSFSSKSGKKPSMSGGKTLKVNPKGGLGK
jgi:hypothetical protein